jgi:hypothetical protein
MSEDQALGLTSALAMLALVVGSLVLRRMPLRHAGRLALLWVAIFAGAFLILHLLPGIVANFT